MQSVVFVTGEIQAEENAGGLTLGSFSALDPDGGDTHTFLLTHDDGDHFTLTPTGLLATAQGPFGLDFTSVHFCPLTLVCPVGGVRFSRLLKAGIRTRLKRKRNPGPEYRAIQCL